MSVELDTLEPLTTERLWKLRDGSELRHFGLEDDSLAVDETVRSYQLLDLIDKFTHRRLEEPPEVVGDVFDVAVTRTIRSTEQHQRLFVQAHMLRQQYSPEENAANNFDEVLRSIAVIHDEAVESELERLNLAVCHEDAHGRSLYLGYEAGWVTERRAVYLARIGSFVMGGSKVSGLQEPLVVLCDMDDSAGTAPVGLHLTKQIYQTVVE